MKELVLVLVLCLTSAYALQPEVESTERNGKVLPIFQVVRFPNDVCTGTTRNGTCFTAEECSNLSGTNEGSCASGFGVCCVLALACGGSSSTNNTYIVQTATTAVSSPCTQKICPCSTDICRIRYDFTTFVVASMQTGTAAAADPTPSFDLLNGAVGNCLEDQFSIASPGKMGSPLICGTNSDQHMIIDSDGSSCQTTTFNIGSATTTSRQWDIYVTQYTCGQEDEAGPPGCLQYYTGTTDQVYSFGFFTQSANTAANTEVATTHLNNQHYDVCVRRESGYCYLCWTQWSDTTAESSFGTSVTTIAMASSVGTQCISDHVLIPGGTTTTIAAATTPEATVSRYCGRMLNPATGIITSDTVCTRRYPFRLGVHFDDFELCTAAADHADCEALTLPGGIIGFGLTFQQFTC